MKSGFFWKEEGGEGGVVKWIVILFLDFCFLIS